MSHFTTLKTALVEKDFLIAALKDLGLPPEEGSLQIRGFGGNRTRVDVKVPTASRGYDVGFRRTGEGYEMIADWWGIRDISQEDFLRRLTHRCAYHAARAKLEAQGFTLVNEETRQDGQIHLVLRRMS